MMPKELKGQAALRYQWLRRAATFDPAGGLPTGPFLSGRERQEVEGLRRLAAIPHEQLEQALKALSLREAGSALALWRWGQVRVRTGAFDRATRRTWEDRLLRDGPVLTRGYALRHALCWALAEQDESRFAALRPTGDPSLEGVHHSFQGLFGLLGGPSPVLRLWTLPGLDYRDLGLDQLASRVWICPLGEEALPALPPGTAWIIPSAADAPADPARIAMALDRLEDLRGRPVAAGAAADAREPLTIRLSGADGQLLGEADFWTIWGPFG